MLAFRDRAKGVWEHACSTYNRLPKQFLVIPERMSATESAIAARIALEQLRTVEAFKRESTTEVTEAV